MIRVKYSGIKSWDRSQLSRDVTLDERLARFAHETHRSKSYYIRKAIEQFLEDREDYLLAVARLEEKNPRTSLEEVMKELGLED